VNSIDLRLLDYLDALLQEGSVTGAARRVGLSTPAMSHALGRLREQMKDPILVRAGRGMVLTPRADELKARVNAALREAQAALAPELAFDPRTLTRPFVVHATDYVLAVIGPSVDRILSRDAPRLPLRFVPNTSEDAMRLRDGGSDLAIGIYGDLPQEMRSQRLLTDRFVCVVREGHRIGKRLTLADFIESQHVQVAPRGLPGGYVDWGLRGGGLTRHVARAVPYFLSALRLVARTDYVLTISERVARSMGAQMGLRVLQPPLELKPYALGLVWHPRFDGDAAHRFVREAFVRAARDSAGDLHEDARSRLDAGDATSGQRRRRRV